MQGHHIIALTLAATLVAGCRSEPPVTAPVPLTSPESNVQGAVVGDDRTAMEAAIDTGPTAMPPAETAVEHAGGVALAPNAPETYVVKRGDTLWESPRCTCAIPGTGPRSGRSTSKLKIRT